MPLLYAYVNSMVCYDMAGIFAMNKISGMGSVAS